MPTKKSECVFWHEWVEIESVAASPRRKCADCGRVEEYFYLPGVGESEWREVKSLELAASATGAKNISGEDF